MPVVGWTSPVRHLMSVDLPAPFGPMHATRDESDTWTVAFSMVTLSLRGYLKETSTTLMRALPLDLTPVPRTCHESAKPPRDTLMRMAPAPRRRKRLNNTS